MILLKLVEIHFQALIYVQALIHGAVHHLEPVSIDQGITLLKLRLFESGNNLTAVRLGRAPATVCVASVQLAPWER